MNKVLLFVTFSACFMQNNGARILGVFPIPSVSHQVVFRALVEELARRGHELVVITTDPVNYNETDLTTLRQIDVHDISYKILRERMNFVDVKIEKIAPFDMFKRSIGTGGYIMDAQLSIPEVQQLINDPKEHFDLCIVEGFYPALYAFKERFKSPLIVIYSLMGFLQDYDAFGVPTHPFLYRDVFSQYIESELSLWQKFDLIYQALHYRYLYQWTFLPMHNRIARKFFGPDMKSVDEIENNADMLFLNYHPISFGIRPLPPAVIPVGSLHVKPPKSLPSNLQKLLDDATEGVIYFSFGGNVKSSQLPANSVNVFLESFKKIPYKVLWKWENETLSEQPKNVFVSKWFPQQDILGHPNIKAFITQGGLQSLEEAIHFKIPLIGIPFFGDQEFNVNKIISLGIGKGLQIDTITVDIVTNAILDIVGDKAYLSNITKLRDLLYDQPQSSMERAVWWTEYVLRHGGARHLRSPGAGSSFWQYFMLDLLAIVLAAMVTLILILRTIYRFFRPAKSNTKFKLS